MANNPFDAQALTQFYDHVENYVYFGDQPKAQIPILAMIIPNAMGMIAADPEHFAKIMTNLEGKYRDQHNKNRQFQFSALQIIFGAIRTGLQTISD